MVIGLNVLLVILVRSNFRLHLVATSPWTYGWIYATLLDASKHHKC